MGMVAWSGDPALQEMAGHITLFIVCCKAKARGTMRTSSPYKSFAAFVTIGKIPPRRDEDIRPAATFIVQHILHNQHPPPKFLIFRPALSPHRRSHQLLPLTS